MNVKQLILLALFFLLSMLNLAWGTLLIEENFDYTVGNLIPNGTWAAHSGSTFPYTVVAPGLSYTGYLSSGIGNAVSAGNGNGMDINRNFYAITTGTAFASFLVNVSSFPTTIPDYPIHFAANSGAGPFVARVMMQANGAHFRFGVSKQSTVTTLYPWTDGAYSGGSYNYDFNTTYLIVIKYEFVPNGTNDIVSLYVNPVISSFEPSPTLTFSADGNPDATTISSICLRQTANTSGLCKFDGLRVAATWADLFPTSVDVLNTIPADGTQSYNATSRTLEWNDVPGAHHYEVNIGTTSGGNDIASGVVCTTSSYTHPADWAFFTTYYWSVSSKSADNSLIVTGPVCDFTTDGPVGVISEASLAFGNVWLNHPFAKPVRIENQGTQPLVVNASLSSTVYTVSGSSRDSGFARNDLTVTIPPESVDTLYVQFLPTTLQTFQTSLQLTTNDSNLTTVTIPLSGTGSALYAEFQSSIAGGDCPLIVNFTNQSVNGLTSIHWNFGDGTTSSLANPSHTFTRKGVFPVVLTVGDNNTTTTVTHTITVIADPLLSCADTAPVDFGVTYLGDTSETSLITINSIGTDTLFIYNIRWKYNRPGFHCSLGTAESYILPGNSAVISVWIAPASVGTLSDSLIIETNAENIPTVKVKFSAVGEYVPPKEPTNVAFTMNGSHAVITWDAVTQTIYNTPLTPDCYLVFFNGSADPDGVFYFHGAAAGTQYTHYLVGAYSPYMFYRVRAYKSFGRTRSDSLLDRLSPGMTEAEVERMMDGME